MKIALCITTHNRNDVLTESLKYFNKYKSEYSDIIIIDDASDIPYPNADYRFNENVGISIAKNKCLELSQDYDYVFLFDSDCYPIKSGFEQLYISSGLNHAMYIFTDFANGTKLNDTSVVFKYKGYTAYNHPRGCMLFYTRKAIDTSGGMRPQLKKWGFEHGELSDRIFSLNLTESPYLDVDNSSDYIYSLDEHQAVETTTKSAERSILINENRKVYNSLFGSTDKVELEKPQGRNEILTTYFTGIKDPQRGINFNPCESEIKALKDSCKGYDLKVFNDCLFDGEIYEECQINPYFQRWITYRNYIVNNPDLNIIWMVDATDVELLKNPFEFQKDILYVGYEHASLLNQWMINNSRADSRILNFIKTNGRDMLLNCGVVGGHRDVVMEFLNKMVLYYVLNNKVSSSVDMPLFNYIVYTYFSGRIITGRDIVTDFKKNEYNKQSVWKHK